MRMIRALLGEVGNNLEKRVKIRVSGTIAKMLPPVFNEMIKSIMTSVGIEHLFIQVFKSPGQISELRVDFSISKPHGYVSKRKDFVYANGCYYCVEHYVAMYPKCDIVPKSKPVRQTPKVVLNRFSAFVADGNDENESGTDSCRVEYSSGDSSDDSQTVVAPRVDCGFPSPGISQCSTIDRMSTKIQDSWDSESDSETPDMLSDATVVKTTIVPCSLGLDEMD